MSNYAKINAMGIVENVIVAEQSHIDLLPDASSYVQTFEDANGDPAKLYNCAAIGSRYDAVANAFIEPQPFNSWALDTKTYRYEAPFAMPIDGKRYIWDEDSVNWKVMPEPAELPEGYVATEPPKP
jgi:hypothetical protein